MATSTYSIFSENLVKYNHRINKLLLIWSNERHKMDIGNAVQDWASSVSDLQGVLSILATTVVMLASLTRWWQLWRIAIYLCLFVAIGFIESGTNMEVLKSAPSWSIWLILAAVCDDYSRRYKTNPAPAG